MNFNFLCFICSEKSSKLSSMIMCSCRLNRQRKKLFLGKLSSDYFFSQKCTSGRTYCSTHTCLSAYAEPAPDLFPRWPLMWLAWNISGFSLCRKKLYYRGSSVQLRVAFREEWTYIYSLSNFNLMLWFVSPCQTGVYSQSCVYWGSIVGFPIRVLNRKVLC